MKKLLFQTVLSGLLLLCTENFAATYFCADGGFSISGDLLYWKAKQQGLDYTTRPLSVLTTTDFTQSSLVAPEFEWKTGFRLAAEYHIPNSCWSTGLQYTQYKGAAQGTQLAGNLEGIFPVLSFSDLVFRTDYVTFAETQWKLSTYLLDIAAQREWWVNDRLSVASILAFRNAWISQNVQATYLGATFTAGPDRVSLQSNFYGIGPRIGLKPAVALGHGFSLYGVAAGSLLYGWFHVHQKETFLSIPVAALRRSPQGVRWNADLIAGLSWTHCTTACAVIKEYSADIGFDYVYFSKQYAFKHSSQWTLPKQNQSLALYGLHVMAGIRF